VNGAFAQTFTGPAICGTTGSGVTPTFALPEGVPAQSPSAIVVTPYAVVVRGATVRTAGLSTTFCWNPSDHVSWNGGVPVSSAWIWVDSPAQIVAEPDIAAVGDAQEPRHAGRGQVDVRHRDRVEEEPLVCRSRVGRETPADLHRLAVERGAERRVYTVQREAGVG
jgi:hypothetical protein